MKPPTVIRPGICEYGDELLFHMPVDMIAVSLFSLARFSPAANIHEGKRPPPWLLAYTEKFKDHVLSIDRKLQGKILEAVIHLSEAPMIAKGDTIKALSGDMKGFWRYRLGDFRLIYYPNKDTGDVSLIDFCPRSGAY